MAITSKNAKRSVIPSFGFLVCYGILIALSFWSWQKWNAVWVERAEGFFPPEFQESPEAAAQMAWKYPIYRSNDSYQWVALADALARGEPEYLQHRPDEGPPGGRPNAWHSGLARLLHLSGSVVASIKDWPIQQGIHFTAHWLGIVLLLVVISSGYWMTRRLANEWAALLFMLLYFFNAAIHWDFAYSRLDHESVFQAGLIFQLFGLFGILQGALGAPYIQTKWALVAGLGSALCWWVGATLQAVIAVSLLLGLLLHYRYHRPEREKSEAHAYALLTWGASSTVGMLLFCLIDGRLTPTPSIAALHPIWILAQLGVALVAAAPMLASKRSRLLCQCIGLVAGLTPLLWLLHTGADAHPWLNPTIRRLHDHIVEFQSPFRNGVWKTALGMHALLIAMVFATESLRTRKLPLGFVLVAILLLLSIFQTRWLGLAASCATISLCLLIPRYTIARVTAILLMLTFSLSWLWAWVRIEESPGRSFVADMILQVGARDINLNLSRYAESGTTPVAMPYAFAPPAALFSNLRPLGSFYWENDSGIETASELYASEKSSIAERIARQNELQFIVVQKNRLGAPFAALATWTAREIDAPETINDTLAWRLASKQELPDIFQEVPFYGTFDPSKFDVRIYRVDLVP